MDLDNLNALAGWNKAHADTLRKICSPLFNNFPINHFTYLKIFDDGYRIFLNPNSVWLERYLNKSLYNNSKHAAHRPLEKGLTIKLWNDQPMDLVFENLLDLNIWNGATFFFRNDTSL